MTTVTAPVKSRKPTTSNKPVARAIRWLYRHPGVECKGAIRLAITYARRTDLFRYWIERLPSDFGVAFSLEKINPDGSTGETYQVCVENRQDGHCCCKGFEAHGHCKYIDCCRALAARM